MLVRGRSAIVVCEGRGEDIWVKVVGELSCATSCGRGNSRARRYSVEKLF